MGADNTFGEIQKRPETNVYGYKRIETIEQYNNYCKLLWDLLQVLGDDNKHVECLRSLIHEYDNEHRPKEFVKGHKDSEIEGDTFTLYNPYIPIIVTDPIKATEKPIYTLVMYLDLDEGSLKYCIVDGDYSHFNNFKFNINSNVHEYKKMKEDVNNFIFHLDGSFKLDFSSDVRIIEDKCWDKVALITWL